MFALPVIFSLFAVLLIVYLINYSKQRDPNFPPGPPRLPLYGSYWFLLFANYKYFHKALIYYHKKYNTNLLGFYLGGTTSIATFNHELCKEVLTRPEFNLRPDPIVVWERCLGKLAGVFFGSNWKEQRWLGLRHLRDFGFGRRSFKVEDYTETEIKDLIELFTTEPKDQNKDVCKRKGVVLMPEVLDGHLMSIILLVLTASRYDYKKLRILARYTQKWLRSVDPTGSSISMTPWLRYFAPDFFGFTSAYRDNIPVINFIREEIAEHRESFISGYPRDFIDVYLEKIENQKKNPDSTTSVSDEEMVMTLLDFIFPASAALGQTISNLFAYLVCNPEVQKKIQEEIDDVVGNARLPNLDDKQNMPYTEATIRESIRIGPINPVGIARMSSETTTLGGYTIPKNTFIYPCVYALHHDPKIWGDPENFRPERWLEASGSLKKKDLTLAFGTGKRLCVGETFSRQTIFLFLSGLLQHFTFVTPIGEKRPDLENLVPGINLTVGNYWMEAVVR